MKVVHSDECVLHNPPHELHSGKFVPYVEVPARYLQIKHALSQNDPAAPQSKPLFEFVEADPSLEVEEYILSVHQKDYVDYLRNAYEEWVNDGGDEAAVLPECFPHAKLTERKDFDASQLPPLARAGLYCFDLDCPIVAETYTSAVAAVRVALTASRILLSSQRQERRDTAGPLGVFALTRPPGHHAGTSLCGGFCFFNNAAIAVRFLQSQALPTTEPPSKVAILDVDYHHGNGTQQIFYEDPSVFYVSLHASQDYPYFTGASNERGAGQGLGFNLNIPLPKGSTGNDEYCVALQEAIKRIGTYDPSYLVLSLGVDTFEDDPICDFKLTTECYVRIGRFIASLQKPTLFVMEGGYDLKTIGRNVRAVLESFVAASERVTSRCAT